MTASAALSLALRDPLVIAGRLMCQPTAPFHEAAVLGVIEEHLIGLGLTPRRDPFGNLIAHYQHGRRPPWALVAHTDHPGLEVTRRSGRTLRATFHGGVHAEALADARMALVGPENQRAVATVTNVRAARGEHRLTLRLDGPAPGIGVGAFGSFDLPPAEINGETIRAPAVDDLIGCTAILAVLAELVSTRASARVTAVFTRAEEVGFVGAQLLTEAGTIPPDCRAISLEASLEMAGAVQGAGPVIRVGDRTTAYTSHVDFALHQAAKSLLADDSSFRFQRQLMTGGTCEGTVFSASGLAAGGIAFALRNYHNMVPGGGVAREEVATPDLLGGIRLLTAAVTATARSQQPDRYLARLRRTTARHRQRLLP